MIIFLIISIAVVRCILNINKIMVELFGKALHCKAELLVAPGGQRPAALCEKAAATAAVSPATWCGEDSRGSSLPELLV